LVVPRAVAGVKEKPCGRQTKRTKSGSSWSDTIPPAGSSVVNRIAMIFINMSAQPDTESYTAMG
jgi:hypothetical protein